MQNLLPIFFSLITISDPPRRLLLTASGWITYVPTHRQWPEVEEDGRLELVLERPDDACALECGKWERWRKRTPRTKAILSFLQTYEIYDRISECRSCDISANCAYRIIVTYPTAAAAVASNNEARYTTLCVVSAGGGCGDVARRSVAVKQQQPVFNSRCSVGSSLVLE